MLEHEGIVVAWYEGSYKDHSAYILILVSYSSERVNSLTKLTSTFLQSVITFVDARASLMNDVLVDISMLPRLAPKVL